MRNLRYAFRTLFKTPFVTVVAILSLALGIGANVAIFSLFDQILLRSLPVPEPERLVNLASPGPKSGSVSCNDAGGCDEIFSYAMFRDLEQARTRFSGLAAHRSFGANLAFQRQTLSTDGTLVSGSYFPVLAMPPALGRLLTPADDQEIGAHPVAVLSHRYWTTQLGADPGVLNQTLVVNGHPFTIVGVAPRGFDGTTLGLQPSVFVPLTMRALVSPGFDGFDDRQTYWAYLFGRLEPGVTMEEATAAVNAAYQPIIREVEAPLQQGTSERGLERFMAREITLAPGYRGQSSIDEDARIPLVLLFATTGIVLLIACANLANLLLVRGSSRRMEIVVRQALGASRRQLLTQLLTESGLLAVLGGAASLLVAQWTLEFVASVLPPEAATILRLELRPSVIAFALLLSVATGLVFGMFPALHGTRPDLVSTIRANAGQIAGARGAARLRSSLVTGQIALAMSLLILAGLFLESLRNISRVDLGLRTDNLVTFGVSPELSGYDPARSAILFERVEEEISALPGVTGVTAGVIAVLANNNWGSNVSVEGFEAGPDTDAEAQVNSVGPGYFGTMGIALLAGREFTAADDQGRPRVAVVNEAFAEKFGLKRDAVGKRMATGRTGELDIEIVGVVQNAKYSEVKGEMPPLFFTAYRQDERIGALTFYVRTSGDPTPVLRGIPAAIARIDPNLPVEHLKTMPQQVRENVAIDRMIGTLSAAFAVLATILAAIGLYGVLAYAVSQRTREIGVRMALGADARAVRRMVLGQVARMVLIGGVIGILAALALGRASASLLFGLGGNDPVVVAVSATILALVALGAGYLPARRAARVEPMQALRYE